MGLKAQIQGVTKSHAPPLRYPLLHHPHPDMRSKSGLVRAYLDLILGWGWYRRGYLRIPWMNKLRS